MKHTKTLVMAFTGLVLSMSQYALAADDAIHVTSTGDVGFGTDAPTAAIELARADGSAQILVSEANATAAQRTLFKLQNNGNTNFAVLNMETGVEWAFVNSKLESFRVSRQGSGQVEMELFENGDLEITGELTTAGSTCGGGCDLVFSEESNIETIEEHASEMWANSYLPAVGPTIENAPINLSEKTGGMLNELEKAHIYIEQLHQRLAQLELSQVETQKTLADQQIQKG